jgi:hypothetical protein
MKNFDLKKITRINKQVIQFDFISLMINIALVSYFSNVLTAFADAAGHGVKDAKIIMTTFCLALVFLLFQTCPSLYISFNSTDKL